MFGRGEKYFPMHTCAERYFNGLMIVCANWGCGGMVDAADLKSVGCNGRASSSLATPTIII